MSKLKILVKLTLIYFAVLNPSTAMTFDRDYLYNFIENYVESNISIPAEGKIKIEVSPIDPRISLQPCLLPLLANIPEKHNSRNVNVKVLCPDEASWQLFIPVKIQTIVPILVTRMRVAKGTLLDNSNIEVIFKDNSQIRGSVLTDPAIVTGARTKRNLSQGSAITDRNTCFVCKGQPVNIIARSVNFEIKSFGIALKDGSLGELIPIKNKESGRIVQGQVNAINQVVINL
ncbi:flagellar basal body P-ring formation protein FlgA [Colwellia sp. Arc7-635]|uniref:flagellar basal body P-ring formation chaperone FlgA n=1 Tax=Colwellia sp. Arc7-635 TaxID=2497879 RepID=UPI000F853AEB|nr:flagellar basal body P-ring formation chaperone FlgA [Colwellia sp. Arc7-635]AZQ85538.1 flagellar basal body P-ring formation protein FlgA [Colwellia sp. Arc7-635]